MTEVSPSIFKFIIILELQLLFSRINAPFSTFILHIHTDLLIKMFEKTYMEKIGQNFKVSVCEMST